MEPHSKCILGAHILVNIRLSPGGELLPIVHGSSSHNRIGQ